MSLAGTIFTVEKQNSAATTGMAASTNFEKTRQKPDYGRAFCRGQIVPPNTTPAKKLLIRQIAPLNATVKRQRNYACRAQKTRWLVPYTIVVKESELHSSQRQQKRPCKCAAKRSGETAAKGKSCKSPPFCCETPNKLCSWAQRPCNPYPNVSARLVLSRRQALAQGGFHRT